MERLLKENIVFLKFKMSLLYIRNAVFLDYFFYIRCRNIQKLRNCKFRINKIEINERDAKFTVCFFRNS